MEQVIVIPSYAQSGCLFSQPLHCDLIQLKHNFCVGFDQGEDCLARNEPTRETHIDVVGPQDPGSADTVLDEEDRVVGDPPSMGHSITSAGLQSVCAERCQ